LDTDDRAINDVLLGCSDVNAQEYTAVGRSDSDNSWRNNRFFAIVVLWLFRMIPLSPSLALNYDYGGKWGYWIVANKLHQHLHRLLFDPSVKFGEVQQIGIPPVVFSL
jgi:hypothetical protein